MNKTSNPVALVLRWAGRNRKYLVASIVCATLSGLMVAVPYFAVFDMMRAVYEGRCTTRVVAVDAAVLVAGTLLRHILFGVSNALAHKGAYGALLDVRCSVLDRLSKAPLGELAGSRPSSPTTSRSSNSCSRTTCRRPSCTSRGPPPHSSSS